MDSYYKHFCSPEEEQYELKENPKENPVCHCELCEVYKSDSIEH